MRILVYGAGVLGCEYIHSLSNYYLYSFFTS